MRKSMSIIGILFMIAGCATSKNESEHYDLIQKMMAGDRYTAAAGQIFKFERKYPKSRKLCSLYPLLIARLKVGDSTRAVGVYKKKLKEQCSK